MPSDSALPAPGRLGRVPAASMAAHDASLVEAAGRLFRESGYAGVSIDMIARGARASPKTIYARYGGKLGLFQAVVEGMVARPLEAWDRLDEEAELQPGLTEAAVAFLSVVLSPEVIAMERAIVAEARRMPELSRTFYARGPRRGLDRLAAFFADQHARGRLRIDDASAAAELFIGMIEGELVRRALFLGEEPPLQVQRDWAAAAVAAFLRSQT